jgi:uncharacterized protein
LAALDVGLSKTYKGAVSACGDKVKQEQREWNKIKNSCGANIECLRRTYRSRIEELENCE